MKQKLLQPSVCPWAWEGKSELNVNDEFGEVKRLSFILHLSAFILAVHIASQETLRRSSSARTATGRRS